MSCAVPPEWLTIRILPSGPTGTTARFGSVCPARKSTLDVDADGAPFAYAVSQPASSGVVTVRFTTTADTPWLGTPPTPVTCTATDADGPTRARRRSGAVAGVEHPERRHALEQPAGRLQMAPRAASRAPALVTTVSETATVGRAPPSWAQSAT